MCCTGIRCTGADVTAVGGGWQHSAIDLLSRFYDKTLACADGSVEPDARRRCFEKLCDAIASMSGSALSGCGRYDVSQSVDCFSAGPSGPVDIGESNGVRCSLRLCAGTYSTIVGDAGEHTDRVQEVGDTASGCCSVRSCNGSDEQRRLATCERGVEGGEARVTRALFTTSTAASEKSSVCVDDVEDSAAETSKRGKHYAKNLAKRLRRKLEKKNAVTETVKSGDSGVVVDERSELQRSFDARRIAENKLAVQKAEFQLKRNEYMTKSRVAELEWETRRLQTDQKLEKITVARLGSKPGFAETLVENNISSTSLPSLSKGTISPDSSISVEEVRKMERLIETLAGQVQSLTTELTGLKENVRAQQLFGGKHDLDENDKIIIPRFKTPDERLEWMNGLSDKELEALGPDYHRDGRKVEDGSRLSFDGYTEDYSLQDEAMKEAGISMIG